MNPVEGLANSSVPAFAVTVVILLGAFAGIAKLWIATADNKQDNALELSKTLLDRVEKLEARVNGLERELAEERNILASALAFIEHLAYVWPSHTIPFPRLPFALRSRLDEAEWQRTAAIDNQQQDGAN